MAKKDGPRENFMRGLDRIGNFFSGGSGHMTPEEKGAMIGIGSAPKSPTSHTRQVLAQNPIGSGKLTGSDPVTAMTDQAFQAYMAKQGLAQQYKNAAEVPIPSELQNATPQQKQQYQEAVFAKQAASGPPSMAPPINPLAAQAFFGSFVAPLMRSIAGSSEQVQTGAGIPVPKEVQGAVQQQEGLINNYPIKSAINAALAQPFADQLTDQINAIRNNQLQTYERYLQGNTGNLLSQLQGLTGAPAGG